MGPFYINGIPQITPAQVRSSKIGTCDRQRISQVSISQITLLEAGVAQPGTE
jgi:hypothetical protein